MGYKLIALDLDDTLLDSNKQISNANQSAVSAAKALGVRVVFASGRAYPGIAPFKQITRINDYIIASAGAQIYDPNEAVILSASLPEEVTRRAVEWALQNNVYFQIYTDEGFRYLSRTEHTDYYERVCGYTGIQDKSLADVSALPPAAKLLFIDTNENLAEYKEKLQAEFPDMRVMKSQINFLEILGSGATKGTALEALADSLNIKREEVMAIGDSEIDESMIRYAGLGVAVSNAAPSVLAAADCIAPSCDEDGVAKAICKFIPEAAKI